MIYIGNDIVKVSRILDLINTYKEKALSHIFTHEEQLYCQSKIKPEIHYAGRFAAKEAIKKAILSYNPEVLLPLNCINILPVKNSAPKIELDMVEFPVRKIRVSISHTDEFATAVAIMEI